MRSKNKALAPTPGKCKSCGALIVWISNPTTGKRQPVNQEPYTYLVEDWKHGKFTLIQDSGEILKGWTPLPPDLKKHDELTAAGEPGTIKSGRRSHFATCPHADKHRRRKHR